MTTLHLRIDSNDPHPPFDQIRSQVVDAIHDGALLPGDKLPTVRALATELGLAANTVARAFKELEASGHVETHGRAGTVVAAGQHTTDVALEALATKFAVAARDAGVDDAAALEFVRSALRAQPAHDPRE